MLRRKMQAVQDERGGRYPGIGQHAPIITGEGDIDHVCAICDAILIASMQLDQVRNLVLKYPRGTLNEVVDGIVFH